MIRVLSEADRKRMLPSVAWKNVRDECRKEMYERLNLSMMKQITEREVRSSCAFLSQRLNGG